MEERDWNQIKVVSWDIDGTLYDLHGFMSALKKDLFRRALTLRWWGLVRDVLRLVRFKRHMDKVRQAPPEYSVGTVPGRDGIGVTMDRLYGELLPTIGVLPGVVDTFGMDRIDGSQTGCFFRLPKSTKLKALHLEKYFSAVYAGEDLGHLKPAETVFRKIIEHFGIAPHELLHIGDRQDTDGEAPGLSDFRLQSSAKTTPRAEISLKPSRQHPPSNRDYFRLASCSETQF